MKINLLVLALVAGLAGCIAVPIGTYQRTTTTTAEGGKTTTVEEFDYIGTGTPVEVVAYPGVVFYPRCYAPCLTPESYFFIGFVGGMWINHLGRTVVHHDHWIAPPRHMAHRHREWVRGNAHMFRHAPPQHGRPGGPAIRSGQRKVARQH